MEKACEFQQPVYVCFIDLRKAYDSVKCEALWHVLQHSFHLPNKLVSIIRAFHEDSTAAVRAYSSIEFAVTSGVRQGVLALTLFNLYLDAVLCLAIEDSNRQGKGVQVAYHLNASLIGNRKITYEINITDLKYVDDMALVFS